MAFSVQKDDLLSQQQGESSKHNRLQQQNWLTTRSQFNLLGISTIQLSLMSAPRS